jgi:hypothetical protein
MQRNPGQRLPSNRFLGLERSALGSCIGSIRQRQAATMTLAHICIRPLVAASIVVPRWLYLSAHDSLSEWIAIEVLNLRGNTMTS